MAAVKASPQYDIETLRSVIGRVTVIRTMSPAPRTGDHTPALSAAYYAGWDDCCAVLDKLLRTMTGLRS